MSEHLFKKVNPMSDQLFEEFCNLIKRGMEQHHVPGVAAGILYQDNAYTTGFGVTNVDHPIAVNDHTLFQIGSITKTFTGTLAMSLKEMGRLQLDAPVRHYLPHLRLADEEVASKVTMHHLLNHTGGWAGDYFSNTGLGEEALARYVNEMASLPQLAPLGEIWAYNNAGFSLAGRVIEVVTGLSYEEAIMDLLLKPLKLEESFFFAQDVMTYRFAVGHFSSEETPEPYVARPWALARSAHSAGGIVSNVCDLLQYARFQMGSGATSDGTRLISAEAMADMQTPHIQANVGNQMGITWFIKEIDGIRMVRHGGGTKGQLSILLIAPEEGFAFTILTNGSRGGYLIDEATKWTLKQYLDLEEVGLQPKAHRVEDLAPYVGEYDAQLTLISIRLEDEELVMHFTPKGGFPDKDSPPPPAPPPTRVAFTGPDEIVALDPPHTGTRADFIRDQDDQLHWLRTSRLQVRL